MPARAKASPSRKCPLSGPAGEGRFGVDLLDQEGRPPILATSCLPGMLGAIEWPLDLLSADHDEPPRIGEELDEIRMVHGQFLLEVLGHGEAPVSLLAGELRIGG